MTPAGITIVRPKGRLDAAGAPGLEAALRGHIAAGQSRLIVDLSDATYISSNGLRVLLAERKSAEENGGALKLCCMNERLAEIFEMAGFDQVFEIYPGLSEAERGFEVRTGG